MIAIFVSHAVFAEDEEDLKADLTNSFDFQTLGGALGRLEAHGDDLMGDMIDKVTGALTFSHTDVSIPGNSGLEVALRRKLSQGYKRETPYQQAFNDWALDIPIAYFSYGYNSSSDHPVFNDGCMTQGPSTEEIRVSSYKAGADFEYSDHASGTTLSIPGAGLTGAQSSHSGFQAGLQDRGANWVSGGQGTDYNGNCAEIAIAPNGTQYKFGRHTFRDAKPQSAPAPYYSSSGLGIEQNGRRSLTGYAWLSVNKKYAVYMVTEVVDVHGNYVRYEYNNNDDLTRIYSNDDREIKLEYNSASSSTWGFELVSKVTADNREWEYAYTSQNVVFGLRLDKVFLPDGRFWRFDDTAMMSAQVYNHWNCVPYNFDPIKITHPDGAVGTFNIRETRHIKQARGISIQGVEDMVFQVRSIGAPTETASELCWPGHLIAAWAPRAGLPYFRVLSVVEKEITGSDIPTATWSFEYRGYDDGGPNDDWRDVSNTWTKITEPDGSDRTYTYISNGRGMGLLESLEFQGYDGVSETITYEYDFSKPTCSATGNPYANSDYSIGSCFTYNRRPQTKMTRVRDGVTYTRISNYDKTGYDFDDYGKPNSVTRYSSQDTTEQRIMEIDYWHNSSANIIGLQQRVKHNGKEFSYYHYNADGTPSYVNSMGHRWETYTYHPDGNLKTAKDALNKTATLTDYYRGIPRHITRRDGEVIQRAVNASGWVTSETNARGYTTSYSYNDAGWMTYIDRPSPWADTSVSYHNLGGDLYRHINWGTKQTTEWYDKMLRPVLVRARPLSGGGVTSYTKTEYDELGRTIFQSQPSTSSNPVNGVETVYDGLGRVKSSAENFGLYATTTTTYLSGNRVRVTDPLGYQTTTTLSGYSSPNDGQPELIQQPEGVNTSMTYDIWGNMLTANQYGNSGGYSSNSTQKWSYDSRLRLCRAYAPETGSKLFQYDSANRLTAYAEGVSGSAGCATVPSTGRVSMSYDSLGRNTLINYADSTPDVAITYDENGNITRNQRGPVVWQYAYDNADQLTQESLSLDGRTYGLSYQYDSMGNITRRTLPSGRAVNYSFDGAARVSGVASSGQNYAQNILYHPNAVIASMAYGNGQSFTQTLNSRQLPLRIRSTLGSNTAIDLQYDYDSRQNVIDIIDWTNRSRDRDMTYDGLSRLKTADGVWGQGSFSYDPLGNLRRKELGSRVVTVAYNSLNRASSNTDTAGSTRSINYDSQGNVTQLGGLTFDYDSSNQPVLLSGSSNGVYVYDGNFRRVKSVVDGKTIYNVYDAFGSLVHVDEINGGDITVCLTSCSEIAVPTSTDYIRANGMTIARLENDVPTYLHPDLLGSPVSSTNTVGGINWEDHYTPFGEKWESSSANNDQMSFTGHIADSATGLTYMQARYYDPVIGRFLSNDPVDFLGHLERGSTQGFNRYAYAYNNPYKYTDPDGELPIVPIIVAGARACASNAACRGAVVKASRKVANTIKRGGRKTKHTDNRHVDRKKFSEKGKFKKPNQMDKISEKTVKKPDRVQDQGDRVRVEKDFKREIGTKGEKTNVTVVDKKTGKRVTQFPKKTED